MMSSPPQDGSMNQAGTSSGSMRATGADAATSNVDSDAGDRLRFAHLRRRVVGRARWHLLWRWRIGWKSENGTCEIGRRVTISIGSGAELRHARGLVIDEGVGLYVYGRLSIGSHTYFGRGAHVSVRGESSIGSRVRLGEYVSIHDENHVYEPVPLSVEDRSAYVLKPVSIGDDVWVGAHSVVLPGATIGRGSVVAAGSVVQGAIPSGVLAGGVPARVIRALTVKS